MHTIMVAKADGNPPAPIVQHRIAKDSVSPGNGRLPCRQTLCRGGHTQNILIEFIRVAHGQLNV